MHGLVGLLQDAILQEELGGSAGGGHTRLAQWTAAALCNLSQQGAAASTQLIDAGGVDAIVTALSSRGGSMQVQTAPAEQQQGQRAVTEQLLLGCLTHIAMHGGDAVLVCLLISKATRIMRSARAKVETSSVCALCTC